jgi:anaerobic ribonucleoside-triphosphate reductase activating protein
VLWFQGCSLGCAGCYNPETHSPAPQNEVSVAELANEIEARKSEIEGISLTGGEPLQQPEAVLALLEELAVRTELSVLIFSGYTHKEIEVLPLGPPILEHADVLIAGRYSQLKHLGTKLLGSTNQDVLLLSRRYTHDQVSNTPSTEVRIHPDGSIVLSGVDPIDLE